MCVCVSVCVCVCNIYFVLLCFYIYTSLFCKSFLDMILDPIKSVNISHFRVLSQSSWTFCFHSYLLCISAGEVHIDLL